MNYLFVLSNHSTNWATTTVLISLYLFSFLHGSVVSFYACAYLSVIFVYKIFHNI